MKTSDHPVRDFLLASPACRTAVSVLGTAAAGVLSGIFVIEISTPIGVYWPRFYAARSFYALLALTFILYAYNRATYRHDMSVLRFLDSEYCEAYMRSKCLPELAEIAKRKIQDGDIGEFVDAMAEFRKILK